MSNNNIKIISYIDDLKTIGSTNYVNCRKNKYINFIDSNDIAKKIFINEAKKINKYGDKNRSEEHTSELQSH